MDQNYTHDQFITAESQVQKLPIATLKQQKADWAKTPTNPRSEPQITLHLTAAMWKITSILSLYNDTILL